VADTYYAGFDSFAYPGDEIMQSLWDNTNLYWCGYYLNSDYAWNQGKQKPSVETLSGMGWGLAPIFIGYQNRAYARQQGILGLQAKWKKEHPGQTDMPQFTYTPHLEEIPRALVGAEGKKSGTRTVDLAIQAGFREESIIYFDCESPDQDDVWLDYFLGWCDAVSGDNRRTYYLGLYTPPGLHVSFVTWLNGQLVKRWGASDDGTLDYWISAGRSSAAGSEPSGAPPYEEFDPTGCGLNLATSWQYAFNKTLLWEEKDPATDKTRKRVYNPADINTSIYQDPGWGE
jgi:hypothetical protein